MPSSDSSDLNQNTFDELCLPTGGADKTVTLLLLPTKPCTTSRLNFCTAKPGSLPDCTCSCSINFFDDRAEIKSMFISVLSY